MNNEHINVVLLLLTVLYTIPMFSLYIPYLCSVYLYGEVSFVGVRHGIIKDVKWLSFIRDLPATLIHIQLYMFQTLYL